jgi:hypothetical protein
MHVRYDMYKSHVLPPRRDVLYCTCCTYTVHPGVSQVQGPEKVVSANQTQQGGHEKGENEKNIEALWRACRKGRETNGMIPRSLPSYYCSNRDGGVLG